jgi:hypothetical protein
MKVKQISVFMENQPGRLAEMASSLGDAGINIMALTVAESSDFGVIRLIVNDFEKAKKILKDRKFTVAETEVLAVEIPDEPGSLGKVLKVFAQQGLNVEYMYAFVSRRKDALIVFRFDNPDKAISALKNTKVRVLTNEEVLALVK